MRPDTHFTTREKCGGPCLKSRRGLTPLFKLDRNPVITDITGEEPEFPESTPDEAQFP